MTVFVVDDESTVRRALERLLRAEGYAVATFASGTEFLSARPSVRPACLILDMAMPDGSGLDLQQSLLEHRVTLPVIFLTGRADIPMCSQAMKRGAADFLTKPVDHDDLLAAVRRAMLADTEAEAGRSAREKILARIASLTPREREVLDLVTTGLLNKQVAAQLGTTEKTIKVHRARVMEKMQVQSLAELVRLVERTLPPR